MLTPINCAVSIRPEVGSAISLNFAPCPGDSSPQIIGALPGPRSTTPVKSNESKF